MRFLAYILLGILSASPALAQTPRPGAVEGQVTLTSRVNPKLVLRKFKRLVVFLEPISGQKIPLPKPAVIRQKDARFTPSFLVIARGQQVNFVNDDDIFHNVFSFSRTKKFDLGTYKEQTSKLVRFDEAGLVKIHCSIHETMNGTIYVAASPYFQVIDRGNAFALKGVLPGRYRLRTWHRRFPAGEARLVVAPGKTATVAVALGTQAGAAN